MRITIDTGTGSLTVDGPEPRTIPLYSDEAFELLSQVWTRIGWNQKYAYTFSWLGRPVIQLPEDLVRVQEVLHRVRPDVVVETGVAHGGSLVFYASLCKAMGHGRVIGVDIEIRAHNRRAIEAHPLAPWITLIEGSSVDPETVRRVKAAVAPGETALVLLDSAHDRAHVERELEAYHDLVTPGSYIVATDGVMQDLADVPRGRREWVKDNPAAAARDFAARHPEFILESPPRPFDESGRAASVTYWPDAWLRRR